MKRIPLLVTLVAAVITVGCGGSDTSTADAKASRVIIIVMENKEHGDVIGSPDAPYMNSLARRYASATRMYGIRHPSLPNYLALTGGSTFGVDTNCTTCVQDAPNLAQQLDSKHVSWKAYMEGMPRPCFTGASYGQYVKRHNPFAYYRNVVENRRRCAKVVPGRQLTKDLGTGRLPRFVWITPGLCNDSHDCDVATGDRYLRRTVPPLLKRLGPKGFLVITYDEGSSDRGCCGGSARGGRIPTVIAGPTVRRGERFDAPVSLYSVLRTVEDAFRLKPLGDAASAKPLNGAFRTPPRLR